MGPLQLFFKKSDISISRKLLQLFFLVITVNDISMLSEVLLKKVHNVETTNTCRCQWALISQNDVIFLIIIIIIVIVVHHYNDS